MRRSWKGGAAAGKEAEFDRAFDAVLADYMEFLRRSREADETNDDPKTFTARHAAGKTALSHIEHIMKLSGDDGEKAKRLDEVQALLGEMRRDMSAEREETPADDDRDSG
ncbi:hypothetical protein EJV46_12205 [Roseococcus sp. SYP-B2431]|uniref:hypothetical protein n=1 Tax=Roseococcus sp. SYP-B2431 TaxID=2496640 RepID=UPI00103BB52D|nr:hypothetical protein [Roseococcus sp. SYP-B2431]TCH97972.1 hypothetical protein EJV46_12205 [Roseococcus sp. SYP-B2431]